MGSIEDSRTRLLQIVQAANVSASDQADTSVALILCEQDFQNALDWDGEYAFDISNPQQSVDLVVHGEEVASFPCLAFSDDPAMARDFVSDLIEQMDAQEQAELDAKVLHALVGSAPAHRERPRA